MAKPEARRFGGGSPLALTAGHFRGRKVKSGASNARRADMEIEIDYYYHFTYVPFRCQNDRDGVGFARTKVEIAELSDEDAPVVMTVKNPPLKDAGSLMDQSYFRFREKDGAPRRVRVKDGYFYVESVSQEELSTMASRIETLNRTFLSHGVGKRAPGLNQYERRDNVVTSLYNVARQSGGLRHELTKDDGGAKVAEKIARQASRVFCVDGVTYELCREPVLAVKFKDDERIAGIVESYSDLVSRFAARDYGQFPGYAATTSLVHAEGFLDRFAPEAVDIGFEVVDPGATCYDGVSLDVVYHARKCLDEMRETLKATSVGALQAYHRLSDSLADVDLGRPSVSTEMIQALEGIVDIGVDPDIEEPMTELSNARYMNVPSTSYRRPVDLDEGTDFGIDLHHVADYRDKQDHSGNAREYAEHALSRWYGRHPEATFDNGLTSRIASTQKIGEDHFASVTEISTVGQARAVCRELGLEYAEAEAAISSGARLFTVSRHMTIDLSPDAGKVLLGLVYGPSAGVPDGEWRLRERDGPLAHFTLEAVSSHVEAMDERDAEMLNDQQLISIF